MIRPVDSFSPNFKSIWKNGDINFSPLQNGIINDAVSQMRTPDKKGKTYEDKYKKWDFYFDGEKNNSVSITAYHRSKTDKSTGEVFSDFRKVIGIYNQNNKFSNSDIKKAVREYIGSYVLLAAGALLVLSMAFGNYFTSQQRDNTVQREILKDNTKHLSEDSVDIYK